MGWNTLEITKPAPHLAGLTSGTQVYFVHSYYTVPTGSDVVATTTDYGGAFASSVWQDNIYACQFHPEKSQAVGLRILENFVEAA
jgi:glutamine amidotransferase